MIFKKSYVIAALLAVTASTGYGVSKWHTYSKQQEQRYSTAATELQAKLERYEALPSIEGLKDISSALDDYTAPWGSKGRGELQELNAKIKKELDSYCTEPACAELTTKQAEYEAEKQSLKDLRAPLDAEGVMAKTFVCTRIFDRQEEEFFIECTDPRVMKRAVVIVDESSAKRLGYGGYFAASVQDEGIQEIGLKDGGKEYVQVYREVTADWKAIGKSKEKIQQLEQKVAQLKYENSEELDKSWLRISKSVDGDLKQVAGVFHVKYEGLKATIAESVGMGPPTRTIEDHPVADVLFVYDLDSAANFEGPKFSKISADGKDIITYNGLLNHGEVINTRNAGMLAYTEDAGVKSCDATVYKGIIVMRDKTLKPTQELGLCDTTFKLDIEGDIVQSESKEGGKSCRIQLRTGEVTCSPIKG